MNITAAVFEIKALKKENAALDGQLQELRGRNMAYRQDFRLLCNALSTIALQLSEARAEIKDRHEAEQAALKELAAADEEIARCKEGKNCSVLMAREGVIEALEAKGGRLREGLEAIKGLQYKGIYYEHCKQIARQALEASDGKPAPKGPKK